MNFVAFDNIVTSIGIRSKSVHHLIDEQKKKISKIYVNHDFIGPKFYRRSTERARAYAYEKIISYCTIERTTTVTALTLFTTTTAVEYSDMQAQVDYDGRCRPYICLHICFMWCRTSISNSGGRI